MTTAHADRILAFVDGLPAGGVDRLASALEGGLLEELGRLLRPVAPPRRDGTFRGFMHRLRLDRELWNLATGPDGRQLAGQMSGDADPFWRLVGRAVTEMVSAVPCSVDPGWGVSCPKRTEVCGCTAPDDPRLKVIP